MDSKEMECILRIRESMSLPQRFPQIDREHPSSRCLPILPKTPPPPSFPNFKTPPSPPPPRQTNIPPLITIALIYKTLVTSRTWEISGAAAGSNGSLNHLRTARGCVEIALNTLRQFNRPSNWGVGVEVGARLRGGGRVGEGGGSGAPRDSVANDLLGQHSAAGDDTGEGEKQIELHGVL